jgi:hypothetical protein
MARQQQRTKPVEILGLHWWIRKGKKPLWRVCIDGQTYYSGGDGSGVPSEHSAEVAWQAIRAKQSAKTAKHTPRLADPLAGVDICWPSAADLSRQPKRVGPAPAFDLPAEVDAYVSYQRQRQAAGEITVHALASTQREAGELADWLRRTGEDISERSIMAYRAYLIARMQEANGKASSLQRKLATAKRVVNWLWEMRVLAEVPRNINSAFTYSIPKNKAAKAVEVYSVDELRQIWQSAPDETRLHIALALNCGMYYADIADLRHDQISDTHISRGRHKTGETGRWRLWGITRALLARYATKPGQWPAEDGQGSYALRHSDGSPLYGYWQDGETLRRVNHIESRFKDTLARCGVSGHFRKLRATGASLVRDASDTDTAKLHLANSKTSIAELHYLADNFDGLDAALLAVEKRLSLP